MFFVNGLALETGMPRIDLPAMHFLASYSGPAATNLGRPRKGSSCSFARFASGDSACATVTASVNSAALPSAWDTMDGLIAACLLLSCRWSGVLVFGTLQP